ncbi:MAG: LOG family protein [Burkholderiales bacterium]|nr:LOG family protein [Burkholderiales bacterium]
MTQLLLDRTNRRLCDATRGEFDPRSRAWREGTVRGERITLREAVRWLQRESGTPCRAPVAVAGARDAPSAALIFAERLGRGLAEMGLTIVCGGLSGVMGAAAKGAAEAGGVVVGLLPQGDWRDANPYVTVPIATGIGEARNAIIARAGLCLVAVGGGFGTLAEIALARQFGVPVFGWLEASPVSGVRTVGEPEEALEHVASVVLALAQ